MLELGDDWQSVYAFAGSDITLFTKFLELMGSGTELKITHTNRNSQELINIAGEFVQKNSTQIKKQLISPKRLQGPVQLEFYNDKGRLFKNLGAAVDRAIGKILAEFGDKGSILVIGRYNFDISNLVMTGDFLQVSQNRLVSNKYPTANLTFMTAHSEKGLGYDNVIIINMLEGRFAFPSQIEDDPIIKLVTYEDTSVPFAEERRLFYVALTRTKNRVYIAAPMSRPSQFLVELIQTHSLPNPEQVNLGFIDVFRLRCPSCGYPLRYQYNSNYGLRLYQCTNDPEVCDFMTNDSRFLKDIFKCPKCADGYMIVKRDRRGEGFYGCSNYHEDGTRCTNTIPFQDARDVNRNHSTA